MKQYLIDASVVHGWCNTKDKHHLACKKFFEIHSKEKLFFPVNCIFEVKSSTARRLGAGNFSGLPGKFLLKKQGFINIDYKFLLACQKNNLFGEFPKLKGQDLIYACIAKLGNFTLVTCDKHFDVYSKKINLLKL